MNGNFDRALRYLASLSAISRISDYKSSVQELVMQVVAVADAYSLKDALTVKEAIDVYFGIPLEIKIVEEALLFLTETDRLQVTLSGYGLSDSEQSLRNAQIKSSRELESSVFTNWEGQVSGLLQGVDFQVLKRCMDDYLGQAFRQHGIETAQILDASSSLGGTVTESLVHILNLTADKYFKKTGKEAVVKGLITQFFQTTDKFPERKRYLVELADGAYSFYTFFIDPDVAARMRDGLRKIDFYLDTNFLWGLLGLHENQYVASSVELFSITKAHNLPFSFKYHKITEQELLRSVASSGDSLRQKAWKASISATLRKSPYVSGIERRFHEKNAEKATDVSLFLKPYENISRIVQDQGIKIDNREVDWGEQVNSLYHEFSDYLERIEKEKGYEAMQHDMRMLYLTRSMRTNSKSPLQAGTMFLTCDTRLYNFDIQNCRSHGMWPSTILPSVLLQILRPVIQNAADFDDLFVKTFSLPEFRSYSKKSSLAVQKMAEILSAVDGLPVTVAEQMLMDDILVKDVAKAKDAGEFVARLDAALGKRIKAMEDDLSRTKDELKDLKEKNVIGAKLSEDGVNRLAEEVRREELNRKSAELALQLEREKRIQAELERNSERTRVTEKSDELSRVKVFLHVLISSVVAIIGAFVFAILRDDVSAKKIFAVFFAADSLYIAFVVRRYQGWATTAVAAFIGFIILLLT